MLTDPLLLGLLADRFLDAHQRSLAGFDQLQWNLFVKMEGLRALFIRITKSPHPVELGFAYELGEFVEIILRLAGEADDERCAKGYAGDGGADLFEGLEEDLSVGSALHTLEDVAGGVLQRHVEVFAN